MRRTLNELLRYILTPFYHFLPLEYRLRFASVECTNIYRCAQPSKAELQALIEKYHIKTIIVARKNILPEELKLIQNLGLNILHIPLTNQPPRQNQINEFLGFMRSRHLQPLFIHCLRGRDRTGLLILIYRIEICGWSLKQAWKEMRYFGHGWLFGASYYRDWIKDRYGDRKWK